ncbi:MAG: RlmE family RNA methyltransferase [Nitrososphaeria archaeon]
MKLSQAKRDYYRKKAKKEGYRSRAAFKLSELVNKYQLIQEGDYVVDFGCAPGGWLQVTSKLVGAEGRVFGFDLKKVDINLSNVYTYVLDVTSPDALNFVKKSVVYEVDLILSDLAPNIVGVWELDHARQIDLTLRVIDMVPHLLRPGGNCVFKIFQGRYLELVRDRLKEMFEKVFVTKPSASRKESSEVYVVCLSFLG